MHALRTFVNPPTLNRVFGTGHVLGTEAVVIRRLNKERRFASTMIETQIAPRSEWEKISGPRVEAGAPLTQPDPDIAEPQREATDSSALEDQQTSLTTNSRGTHVLQTGAIGHEATSSLVLPELNAKRPRQKKGGKDHFPDGRRSPPSGSMTLGSASNMATHHVEDVRTERFEKISTKSNEQQQNLGHGSRSNYRWRQYRKLVKGETDLVSESIVREFNPSWRRYDEPESQGSMLGMGSVINGSSWARSGSRNLGSGVPENAQGGKILNWGQGDTLYSDGYVNNGPSMSYSVNSSALLAQEGSFDPSQLVSHGRHHVGGQQLKYGTQYRGVDSRFSSFGQSYVDPQQPVGGTRNISSSSSLPRDHSTRYQPSTLPRDQQPYIWATGSRHSPRPHGEALPTQAPEPTPEYLEKTVAAPAALTWGQTQLLVLDLNGTLVFRRKSNTHEPVSRPGLKLFLDFIFREFVVMVWTSAQPGNAWRMVNSVFTPQQRAMLLAVWARDTLGLTDVEYYNKVAVYKRLTRIWTGQHALRNPNRDNYGSSWDQTNTILMDDSVAKAVAQPYNLIQIPEFEGTKKELKEDRVLYDCMKYLDQLRYQSNASAYIRQSPFRGGA